MITLLRAQAVEECSSVPRMIQARPEVEFDEESTLLLLEVLLLLLLLKALDGAYRLTPKGSGTDVTYELSVDLIIPMIGLLKRKAEKHIINTALTELKKRVEG